MTKEIKWILVTAFIFLITLGCSSLDTIYNEEFEEDEFWKRNHRIELNYQTKLATDQFQPLEMYSHLDGPEIKLLSQKTGTDTNFCVFTDNFSSNYIFGFNGVNTTWIAAEYSEDFKTDNITGYVGTQFILDLQEDKLIITSLYNDPIDDKRLEEITENSRNYLGLLFGESKSIDEKYLNSFENFNAVSKSAVHSRTCGDNVDMAFSLMGGEEEERWIQGWTENYELLYKRGGTNERNVLFLEKTSASSIFGLTENTYWYSVKHDPITHEFSAVLYIPGYVIGNWYSDMDSTGVNESSYSLNFDYVSISEEGTDEMRETEVATNMTNAITFVAHAADYYLCTRKKWDVPHLIKGRIMWRVLQNKF